MDCTLLKPHVGRFFRIRNFEKYQHYSDRRPPWIKLYRDLWDDPRFFALDEAARYYLIGLFIIASQHENKIPDDQRWLRAQLLTSKRIPIHDFIAAGWVEWLEHSASDVLAECYPSRARGETETEVQRQNTEIYAAYGEFGHAKMTEAQHAKLKAKLDGNLEAYIDRFDRWLEENPSKRKRRAYLSILNWFDRDVREGKAQKPPERAEAIEDELDDTFIPQAEYQAIDSRWGPILRSQERMNGRLTEDDKAALAKRVYGAQAGRVYGGG